MDGWQSDGLDLMLGLRHDDKWACFEYAEWVSRQNGKGGIGEARVLAGMFIVRERLMLWSAHEYKTAMEAFRRVDDLLHALGRPAGKNLIIVRDMPLWIRTDSGEERMEIGDVPVKVNNTNGEESFERLDTRQRLKFIARSKGSGRGFSGDLNIIDEAFAYTLLQQAALMPTLSARPNPQLVYLSSPPLTGDTGEVMYRLRKRALAGGDNSLGYRDWGLPGDLEDLRHVDLDDPQNYAATNPALGIRITLETVLRERRSMSDHDFARERLGIWPRWVGDPEAGWAVITEAAWTDALDPKSQIIDRPAYGVYVPPDRSYTAIGVSGASETGRHVEITSNDRTGMDYRPGTGWVIPRLQELDKHNPSVMVIDDKALADAAEAAGLVIHRANVGDMVTGCQLLYDGICGADQRTRDVRHIGQKELTDAARGAIKRDVGGSWAWARRDVTTDAAPIAAVSLALFGHCTPRVHRIPDQPFFATYR